MKFRSTENLGPKNERPNVRDGIQSSRLVYGHAKVDLLPLSTSHIFSTHCSIDFFGGGTHPSK